MPSVTMKKTIYIAVTFIILIFMVTNPIPAVEASKTGLILWFQTIIPTLLPFIILSNMMLLLNGTTYITFWISPILSRLLGISKDGCYAVITGFLCGYPMGAKVTSDLVKQGKISALEGNYLICFCNNISPMFILSFIIAGSLQAPDLTLSTMGILYAAPIICALIFSIPFRRRNNNIRRTFLLHKKETALSAKEIQSPVTINFKLIDRCIMDGFETVTKLGGYIILFSIISQIAALLPLPAMAKYFLLGSIEITNGVQILASSGYPFELTYTAVLAAASFGGFSSIAQTESMLKESGLSILSYFSAKLLCTVITIGLALCYLFITG